MLIVKLEGVLGIKYSPTADDPLGFAHFWCDFFCLLDAIHPRAGRAYNRPHNTSWETGSIVASARSKQLRSYIFLSASLNHSSKGWDCKGTKKRIACATRKVKRMTF